MADLWRRNGWWARRLGVLPLHLLVFAIVVFFLVRLVPGDPISVISGGQPMTEEQMAAARASLGLDGSVGEQLLTYLGNVVTLRFGTSIVNGSDVLTELGRRLPETLELTVMAMVVGSLVAAALAFLVVLRPRNPVSTVVASYSRAAGAVPDFCLGVAGIFVFYSVLQWAPAPIGRYDPLLNAPPQLTGFPFLDALLSSDVVLMGSMLAHLWLPVGVLVVAYSPMLVKLLVRSLTQAKDAQCTAFRVASGASRPMVLVSVGRRALPATVAMFGTIFGFMLGGAVVVEQLFAIPGMGEYAVQAVTRSDFVALQGFLLLVGALSLAVFFLVDVVTMLLDPRRRPGVSAEGS